MTVGFIRAAFIGIFLAIGVQILAKIVYWGIDKYNRTIRMKKIQIKRIKLSYITPEIIDLLAKKNEYHSLLFTQNGVYVTTKYRRK